MKEVEDKKFCKDVNCEYLNGNKCDAEKCAYSLKHYVAWQIKQEQE